jgi:hypothetical protein
MSRVARAIKPNTFAEACVEQNSITELAEALVMTNADRGDMETWKIDAEEWRQSIFDAICAKDPANTGAAGGKAKTQAKISAARDNGKKGGRPKTLFCFIIWGTSRNASGGPRYSVSMNSQIELTGVAIEECDREGTSLEQFAGIPMIEDENGDFAPERSLDGSELFEVALQKLRDDGRSVELFPATKAGAKEFLKAAQAVGLSDKAQRLVN